MREIKFRAKTATTNRWVYGHYAFIQGYHVIYEDGEPFVIVLSTLGQYTGLKDQNGVEIYEGDIVRFTNSLDEIDNEVGKVTWEQSECNFVVQYKTANCVTQEENGTTITIYLISNETYRECVEYEVVGSIYENKNYEVR